jgi:hypothetical protein
MTHPSTAGPVLEPGGLTRPSPSQVVLRQEGGQTRLICPSRWRHFAVSFLPGLVCLLVLVAALVGTGSYAASGGLPSPALLLVLVPLVCGIGGLTSTLWAGCPHTELTLAGNRLVVEVSWTLRPRRWEWGLHQVTAVRVVKGVRIASADRSVTVLADRERATLTWVTWILNRALAAAPVESPGEVLPQPGELEVTFASRPGPPPARGFLRCGPGELAVRHDFLKTPQYEFFAAAAWTPAVVWRAWRHGAYPLAPADVSCRVEAGGTAAAVQVERSAWPRVALVVWCDDKEALVAALARFWGARE